MWLCSDLVGVGRMVAAAGRGQLVGEANSPKGPADLEDPSINSVINRVAVDTILQMSKDPSAPLKLRQFAEGMRLAGRPIPPYPLTVAAYSDYIGRITKKEMEEYISSMRSSTEK
ncbi:MAG: hypothetical protein JSS09_02170 [Verrucomicrobia bacterium]|nr:hypothetical protein [Verrucomicrobiota bacterium]